MSRETKYTQCQKCIGKYIEKLAKKRLNYRESDHYNDMIYFAREVIDVVKQQKGESVA